MCIDFTAFENYNFPSLEECYCALNNGGYDELQCEDPEKHFIWHPTNQACGCCITFDGTDFEIATGLNIYKPLAQAQSTC